MPKSHPTVDRVVAILETIAAHPDGMSMPGLVREVNIPKSTVHTLVQGLLTVDYLRQDAAEQLLIGAAIEFLSSTRGEAALVRVAHPELQHVATQTGETAQLAVRVGDLMMVVDQVESQELIRYAVPRRARRPMLTTSMGKLFLAELDKPELQVFLREHGGTRTAAAKRLQAQQEQIQAEQIACNDEESVAGVYAVGAGVRGRSGMLLAALVAAGPADRMRPQAGATAKAARTAAKRVSQRLQEQ